MSPLKIIFAGAGEFGLPTLRALFENTPGQSLGRSQPSAAPDSPEDTNVPPLEIVHVFSQPDRPAGRGRKLAPTVISQFALDHHLPLTRTQDINAEPLPPADLMVVIAFGQKISQAVANHPRLGSVNLHSSRLPKYRGAAPINWAVIDGQTVTGNSIIRLAERMDAGRVLAMSTLQIGEFETAGELHDRLAADGALLMLQTIQRLANGTAEETEQDESQATRALKLNRESTRIDWTHPAQKIANQIRGMYPWPACRVKLVDPTTQSELARLTLVRARALQDPFSRSACGARPTVRPGSISPDQTIATPDGAVEILELQPEGKRPMSLSAYTNGHPWPPGARLESLT
jgi:methionyl-tRNA formyltransferase